jgi:hypothetical protein
MTNRMLTDQERDLVRWMLESGSPDAKGYLWQVDLLEVSPWKCQCGCASLKFEMKGYSSPKGGLRPLAEYVFGSRDECSGIFIYMVESRLGGIEVYGLTGQASQALPEITDLVPWEEWSARR